MQFGVVLGFWALGFAVAGASATPLAQTLVGVDQLITTYFDNSTLQSFLNIITTDCYNQTSNSDIMNAVLSYAMSNTKCYGLMTVIAQLHSDLGDNDFNTAVTIIEDVLCKKGYPILKKMKKKAKKEKKAGSKSKADIINDEYSVALKYLTNSYVKGTFTALQTQITKQLGANDWQIIVNDMYSVLLFSKYGYTKQ